jgi:hypothetical protein
MVSSTRKLKVKSENWQCKIHQKKFFTVGVVNQSSGLAAGL